MDAELTREEVFSGESVVEVELVLDAPLSLQAPPPPVSVPSSSVGHLAPSITYRLERAEERSSRPTMDDRAVATASFLPPSNDGPLDAGRSSTRKEGATVVWVSSSELPADFRRVKLLGSLIGMS